MSVAHGGQVVVSAATSELVRGGSVELVDLGEHRLRDLEDRAALEDRPLDAEATIDLALSILDEIAADEPA
jgi:class 3 adenylate cyclase